MIKEPDTVIPTVSVRWRASYPRMQDMNEYHHIKIVPPSGTIWSLNGNLVRVYHNDRSNGMITLFDINDERLYSMLTEEWVRKRERVWKITDTARLMNRMPDYIKNLVKEGVLPEPKRASKGGKRAPGINSYYTEKDILDIRQILSERRGRGRKRRDGLFTNNTIPSPAEVRSKMGLSVLQYTKNDDGTIIPIWRENS